MTYYLILTLAAIVFYVFLFFAAKNWHWLDITALALMFPTLLIFFTLSVMLLGTYHKHRTVYENHKIKVENQLRENQMLRHGWANSARGELEHRETWLTRVREELGRKLFDRGRVWRNCLPGEFDGTKLTVITAQWNNEQCSGAELPNVIPDADPGEAGVEAPGATGPQAARPHGIEDKMVLYLFAETPLAQLDPPFREAILAGVSNTEQLDVRGQICTVPTAYLGEFTVMGTQPESITLQPTIPLSELQIAVLNDPQSTWSLLEMMPVDSHQAFEDLNEDNKRALFPEQLVNEYIRHGQLIEFADRDIVAAERTMIRIEFKESYNDIVVDATDEPPLLPSSNFDTLGQAVPAWLRQGGEGELAGRIEVEAGEIALFDANTAQQLITDEIAEELDRVYVRQLWDYEFLFHKLYRQSMIVEDKIAVTRQDIAHIEEATAKTLQSVKYRKEEFANLDHDKTGFDYERDQITRYHESLDKRYRETLRQLSTLYQESLVLAQQLSAESQLVEGIVNARSREGGVLVQP